MSLEGHVDCCAGRDDHIGRVKDTVQVRATDSMGNLGYSAPATPFNVPYVTPALASHSQVGPSGIGDFCERGALATGTNPPSIAFTGRYTAGQTIILQASMVNAQQFQTTLNGAINSMVTTITLNTNAAPTPPFTVAACANFPTPPFDIKVNEHPGYTVSARKDDRYGLHRDNRNGN